MFVECSKNFTRTVHAVVCSLHHVRPCFWLFDVVSSSDLKNWTPFETEERRGEDYCHTWYLNTQPQGSSVLCLNRSATAPPVDSCVIIFPFFFFPCQSAQEQERSVVTYRPHSRPIGHIVVPPTHPLTVYTCSYDSTLRCCHIEKGVFEEVSCSCRFCCVPQLSVIWYCLVSCVVL